MKPRNPPLQSTRVLDQIRERSRYLHYSLSTEKAYVYWARFFIRWQGVRHPPNMGHEVLGLDLAQMQGTNLPAPNHTSSEPDLLYLS